MRAHRFIPPQHRRIGTVLWGALLVLLLALALAGCGGGGGSGRADPKEAHETGSPIETAEAEARKREQAIEARANQRADNQLAALKRRREAILHAQEAQLAAEHTHAKGSHASKPRTASKAKSSGGKEKSAKESTKKKQTSKTSPAEEAARAQFAKEEAEEEAALKKREKSQGK